MGLPTAGFDARSESPTEPTARLWRVSRSNLRGDADFLTTKLRAATQNAQPCCQEIRVTAEVRPTDAPQSGRGLGRRLTTGIEPGSRKAHALQDNRVHESWLSYN